MLNNHFYYQIKSLYNGKNKPSYVKMGEECFLTRQTASKRFNELLDLEYIVIENGIIKCLYDDDLTDDEVNFLAGIDDKEFVNFYLGKTKEKNGGISTKKMLDIARVSYGKYYNEKREKYNFVVYGIKNDGMLKYVGSTIHFNLRVKEHQIVRDFLGADDFFILGVYSNKGDMLSAEKALIKFLQPEWNKMSKDII